MKENVIHGSFDLTNQINRYESHLLTSLVNQNLYYMVLSSSMGGSTTDAGSTSNHHRETSDLALPLCISAVYTNFLYFNLYFNSAFAAHNIAVLMAQYSDSNH